MPFIIDGHNLIPKLGISISAEDDEVQLVQIIQEYSRLSRKGLIEIYFDKAAQGSLTGKIPSFLKIVFVKNGITADNAIIDRVRQLKNASRNWTVVSSDQYVQREVKRLGATVLTSDEFARVVITELNKPSSSEPAKAKLSADEVDAWLKIFEQDADK